MQLSISQQKMPAPHLSFKLSERISAVSKAWIARLLGNRASNSFCKGAETHA